MSTSDDPDKFDSNVNQSNRNYIELSRRDREMKQKGWRCPNCGAWLSFHILPHEHNIDCSGT